MTGDVENSPNPLGIEYKGPVGADLHQVNVNGSPVYVPTASLGPLQGVATDMAAKQLAARDQSVSGAPSGIVRKPLAADPTAAPNAANPQPAGDYWSDPSRYNAAPAPVGAGNENLNAPAPVPNLGKTAPVTQPNAAPIEPGGPPKEQPTGPVATPTPVAATPMRSGAGGRAGAPIPISAAGKLLDRSDAEATDAAKSQAAIDTDIGKQELATAQGAHGEAETNNVARDASLAHYNQLGDDALTKSRQISQDFLSKQVDPNHYYNSRTTAQHIMGGLAMIVSGFGAGLAHQENAAIKANEDAQNRDIDAQKFNIQHGKDASEMYENLFKNYQAAGISREHAFQLTALDIKDKQAQQNAITILQHAGPVAAQKYAEATSKIDAARAQQRLELMKDVDTHQQSVASVASANANTAHTNAEMAQMGAGQTSMLALKTGQSNLAKGVKFAQLPPDQKQALVSGAAANETLLPNKGITQRKITPEEHTQIQALDSVRSNLRELDRLAKKGALSSPADLAAAKSVATTLQAQMPAALGSKTKISEGSQDALGKIIDDPGRNLLGVHQKVSSELKKSLHTVEGSLHSDLGLTPFAESPDEAQAAALGATPAS